MKKSSRKVETRKVRVVVLGGGIAALSAAFELSHPRHHRRYDVSIYQLGWRLGGKCASGRDLDTSQRITEHGPHILFGSYDNAFRLMRECYQELNRPASHPFRTFESALVPQSQICVLEKINGHWSRWPLSLPPRPGLPGQGDAPTPWQTFADVLQHLIAELQYGAVIVADVPAASRSASASGPEVESRSQADVAIVKTAIASTQLALEIVRSMDPNGQGHTASQYDAIQQSLTAAQERIIALAARMAAAGDDVRHFIILANLGFATLIGATADRLWFPTKQDLDRANQIEYRAWLQKYRALPITLKSAIVRAMYDTVFAYPNGDTTAPGNVEAGSSVRAQVAAMGYRGPAYWKMRAGTGDVTAAPLYQLLNRRGVKFNFFHRVDALTPNVEGTSIDSVSFGRQVKLVKYPYNPLLECEGLPVWPDRPCYDQIVDGAKLKGFDLEDYWTSWQDADTPLVLKRGTHFDKVVLAVSLGALQQGLCAQLANTNAAWQQMLRGIGTVQTQCVQLWFNETSGWSGPTELRHIRL